MITPVDLENKEFKRSFRGYDIDEVETFLEELVKDYSRIYRENAGMKDKNAILNDAVENYKGMEETMRSAIISAQRTSDEILRNAHEQADTIVKEAKLKAKEIINDANSQIHDKKRECAEIEGRSSMLRAKLRTVLNTYLQMLDELPEEQEATKRMQVIVTEDAAEEVFDAEVFEEETAEELTEETEA